MVEADSVTLHPRDPRRDMTEGTLGYVPVCVCVCVGAGKERMLQKSRAGVRSREGPVCV